MTRVCTKCKVEKDYSEFAIRQTWCKACTKVYGKEYREKNKIRIAAQTKQWYENNKDHVSLLRHIRYLANKDKENEYHVKHKRERMTLDPGFKVINYLRSRLCDTVKGRYRDRHTLDLLGMPISVFKTYISCMFTPDRTWENWGTVWQLHHIKPLSSFSDLSDPVQQEEAFNFENMRPVIIEEHKKIHSVRKCSTSLIHEAMDGAIVLNPAPPGSYKVRLI